MLLNKTRTRERRSSFGLRAGDKLLFNWRTLSRVYNDCETKRRTETTIITRYLVFAKMINVTEWPCLNDTLRPLAHCLLKRYLRRARFTTLHATTPIKNALPSQLLLHCGKNQMCVWKKRDFYKCGFVRRRSCVGSKVVSKLGTIQFAGPLATVGGELLIKRSITHPETNYSKCPS
ncbi:hypothetical protein TcasGA2_TC012333 [Tribolium castaneum]|uniref:Uncharacterized protein n=1 Tax=Tribolium castaneum TaxID=7070 RepID=D6X1Q7_TRICA|nr:hypothetical protein TcasGA2_TC012333 [Tribolium castaneum]